MSGRLILLRHGQTHANVARRLDTRPPGAELTDLGRRQARRFARSRSDAPALVLHSAAVRCSSSIEMIVQELLSILSALDHTAPRSFSSALKRFFTIAPRVAITWSLPVVTAEKVVQYGNMFTQHFA